MWKIHLDLRGAPFDMGGWKFFGKKKITQYCGDWKKKKNHQTWGVKKKSLLPKAMKQKNSIRPQNQVVKW